MTRDDLNTKQTNEGWRLETKEEHRNTRGEQNTGNTGEPEVTQQRHKRILLQNKQEIPDRKKKKL